MVAKRRACPTSEHVHGEDQRRQRHEGHEAELPVDREHRDHDADQGHHVGDRGDRARGEELADAVDVVREARDDAADRRAIEVRDPKLLHVREDRGA